MPDIYQGTELWDFSLVDPDNRRPVDYAVRRAALDGDPDWPALLAGWRDGRIKERHIAACSPIGPGTRTIYAQGDYRPLAVAGARRSTSSPSSASSAARASQRSCPASTDSLSGGAGAPLGPVWGDARVSLAQGAWRDVATGADHAAGEAGRRFRNCSPPCRIPS